MQVRRFVLFEQIRLLLADLVGVVSEGMFRPSANTLSIIMFGTCSCVHTQAWEAETSFKLVYFEFVGSLVIYKNAMEVKYRGKINKLGYF